VSEYAPRPLTQKSREAMQRRLCATVLTFEGFVVFFGALVAARLSDVGQQTSLAVGGGLALACILSSGALRSPHGIAIGWAVQVLVLATGVIVPAMFFMGAIFLALWVAALRIGAMVAPR
jgi:hypothetical protein